MEHTAVLLVPSKSTTAESLVITCGPPLGSFTGPSLQRSLEIEVRGMAIAAINLGKKKKTPDTSLENYLALKLVEDLRGH